MNTLRVRRWFPRAIIALVALFAAASLPAANAQSGQATPPSEMQLKAAFLYKFAGYVEWPLASTPGPGAPLVIGVMNSDALLRELAEITGGRTVDNHPIEVRRVDRNDLLAGVQILFIGDAPENRVDSLIRPALRQPILTVTESRGAISNGSIINFTVDRDRVRFEVSLPAAEASRLKLSSRLLAVASRVHRQVN